MTLGDFQLHTLSDGGFRLDGGAMFGVVPKPLWEKRAPADPQNRIGLGLRPLLVEAGGRRILIDAGIGAKMSEKETAIYAINRQPTLDESLAAIALTSKDIDIVIATHLHFDHVGGLTALENGHLRPRFVRAPHYVRRGEWDDATHPHERNRASYMADNFVPLEEAGLLRFTEDDGEIVPGVSVWRTGGHTMHHQMVRIESGGQTACYVADLMPTSAHVDPAWVMGYDLYPMDTFLYKKRFVKEAIAGEYVIFFEHDPAMAAGIIREKNGRPYVEPIRT